MLNSLVITTISSSNNPILKKINQLSQKNNISPIIIGDKKSPKEFNLKNAKYLNISDQNKIYPAFSKKLPTNHYARKNIGYLLAKHKNNSDYIFETDDDNIPRNNFFNYTNFNGIKRFIKKKGCVNTYSFFSNSEIWPRGYPLEEIINNKKLTCSLKQFNNIYIKQNLVDENPDVDAIYRLSKKLPFRFLKKKDFALIHGQYCPFNSQNTIWKKEALPLMYLPSFCSFRMTDIWRSFVSTKICHELGWGISFGSSTADQKRNIHDLMSDFRQEIVGYNNNLEIINILKNLKINCVNTKDIPKAMIKCYEVFISMGLIDSKEIKLINEWHNCI